MSTSEEYRKVEDATGKALMLHEMLVQEIHYKLNGTLSKEKGPVKVALYQTSIACGQSVLSIAHVVNEFLAAYSEQGREKEDNGTE